ncbi:MAG: class I SAM-dependent methyltransferase [Chloroflexi bacterium]|nr:class I SAM-dependent methyltransferase [Chloroflexota bacterium]
MGKSSKPLPQSPSGISGKFFGRIMEWLNSGAYYKTIKALEPKKDERFLEIGFGTGRFAELLLTGTSGVFMAGLDPTSTMVVTAQQRFKRKGLGNQVDFREGTDEIIPWDNEDFDAVIAIHSFQFWQNPENTFKEINRVLKPNGRMILVFRNHSSNPPDWLPNPISRSGQEVELTTTARKLWLCFN